MNNRLTKEKLKEFNEVFDRGIVINNTDEEVIFQYGKKKYYYRKELIRRFREVERELREVEEDVFKKYEW